MAKIGNKVSRPSSALPEDVSRFRRMSKEISKIRKISQPSSGGGALKSALKSADKLIRKLERGPNLKSAIGKTVGVAGKVIGAAEMVLPQESYEKSMNAGRNTASKMSPGIAKSQRAIKKSGRA